MNLFFRLRAAFFPHPIAWLVFYHILKYELRSPDHLFRRCDNLEYYKVYNFPPSKMVEYALDYLRPSTANIKYWNLYRRQHAKPYGGGSGFPDRDRNFLIQSGCKTVLDFGCGQGLRKYTSPLVGLRYDPCVPKFWNLPLHQVDALVSFDVLEHIPENELKIIAKWIKLYARKCVILGIATRPAKAILPNGENAHCTVRTPDWWANWTNDLPFKIRRLPGDENYIVLHLSR
jgi:hypothetical protein